MITTPGVFTDIDAMADLPPIEKALTLYPREVVALANGAIHDDKRPLPLKRLFCWLARPESTPELERLWKARVAAKAEAERARPTTPKRDEADKLFLQIYNGIGT